MKLLELYRPSVHCIDNSEIREFRILPTITILLRKEPEGRRLKYWFCRIEWLEWYVNIVNPWYKSRNKEENAESFDGIYQS